MPGPRMPGGPKGPMLGPRGRGAPPQAPRRGIRANRLARKRPSLPPLPQTKGVSLREFPVLLKQLPQHKPWMITISVISVLVVLGACGFGSFQLLKQEVEPAGTIVLGPSEQRRDITSRELDSAPLTIEFVFPSREIAPAEPDLPPYRMVGDPQADENCQYTGDSEVKRLLAESGCSQFIRASFISYDDRYHATAGVLNLPDMASATDFRDNVKALGESDVYQGTLGGYVSDRGVNGVLGVAAPHLTMEVHGHFLLYVVVVRKDGAPMEPDEQGPKVVVYDLLQNYLRDTVMRDWALQPGSASAPATDPAVTESPAA